MKIFGKELRKRSIVLAYIKFLTFQSRGRGWVNRFQAFINISNILVWSTLLSLKFPQVPYWSFVIGIAIVGFLMEFVVALLGWGDFSLFGLWEIENEFQSKTQQLVPFNVELMETQKRICDRLGIDHCFRDVYRKEEKGLEDRLTEKQKRRLRFLKKILWWK